MIPGARRRISFVFAAIIACSSDAPPPDQARAASTTRVTCSAVQSADWAPANVGAATFVVNRATHGMAARTRWALSPDSAAIIVIEDPAGVENEAIPDGVMFASERTGRTWRMDSVWSAAPSPDWRSVAVGRGVVMRNGESDSIPATQWAKAAASLRAVAGDETVFAPDSLRAHAFPVSGMTYALGVAATFIVHVDRDTAHFPIAFARMGGWSVAWSCASDSLTLLTGDRPARVQDDDSAMVTTPALVAERVRWIDGPVLDISAPLARDATRRMIVRGREIEQRGAAIAVRDGGGAWRTVGPGIPLASTRGGRFILAIAPRVGARPYESPDHTVVYRIP